MALKLTLEEQGFLKHSDVDTLRFFSDIKDHRLWPKIVRFFILFNDAWKNHWFDHDVRKQNAEDMKVDLAYHQGMIEGVKIMIHLFAGAKDELTRREERAKNHQEELKRKAN